MLNAVVDFDHVYAQVRGKEVLTDITFSILKGSFIGIIGPNGAGKTTLLRLILGLLEPEQGRVTVLGGNPAASKKSNGKVGYLPQRTQFDRRFPASAGDVVLMGVSGSLGLFKLPGRREREQAKAIMDRLNITELMYQPIGELSGGQQQLALLAAALVPKPGLLVLDEPTNGLDPSAQDRFYKLLKEMQSEMSMTVITVSHDLAAIAANADRLICINKTMHMHGSPVEVMKELSGGRLHRCEFELLFGSYGWREQA